jgi:hypothetical protein
MQSVIVYRNPAEAAFWEMLSSGAAFPVIAGIVVFFAVFLVIQAYVVEKIFGRLYRSSWPTNVNLIFSGTVAITVAIYLSQGI